MRFIPTNVHGLANYIVGVVVIALPFYFGWSQIPRLAFVALGLPVIVYSLLTDYELGFFRILPIRFHPAGRLVRHCHAFGFDAAEPSAER